MTQENCPDCGRPKAQYAEDILQGACPKWWAIRDETAEAECKKFRNDLSTPVQRSRKIIDALNKQGGGKVLHGVLQASIIATANDMERVMIEKSKLRSDKVNAMLEESQKIIIQLYAKSLTLAEAREKIIGIIDGLENLTDFCIICGRSYEPGKSVHLIAIQMINYVSDNLSWKSEARTLLPCPECEESLKAWYLSRSKL